MIQTVKERIELLRETLNKMIMTKSPDHTALLEKSQEMDKLILEVMQARFFSLNVLGDEHMEEFNEIVNRLHLIEKMYQSIRIVDPISKRVLVTKENNLHELNTICYEFWKKQAMCDNCISMRAFNENEATYKIEQLGTRLFMVTAFPLSIKGKKIVVELINDVTHSLFLGVSSLDDQSMVMSTIENMNQAAVKDELTGLYNRRYINEKLPNDLLNYSIQNKPLSLILIDLDFFKSINDTFGHSIGDHVLKDFSAELETHICEWKGWAARYGGDEFMLCLPGTDNETANRIAEQIRKSILQKEFTYGDEKLHLSCSFGVHTLSEGEEALTVDAIIDLADRKLYRAKHEGRNKA